MTEIIVDSNIFINVWGRETDPKTGVELWQASAEIISAPKAGRVKGYVSIISVFELVHFMRNKAEAMGNTSSTGALVNIEILILPIYFSFLALLSVLSPHFSPYKRRSLKSTKNTNFGVPQKADFPPIGDESVKARKKGRGMA